MALALTRMTVRVFLKVCKSVFGLNCKSQKFFGQILVYKLLSTKTCCKLVELQLLLLVKCSTILYDTLRYGPEHNVTEEYCTVEQKTNCILRVFWPTKSLCLDGLFRGCMPTKLLCKRVCVGECV